MPRFLAATVGVFIVAQVLTAAAEQAPQTASAKGENSRAVSSGARPPARADSRPVPTLLPGTRPTIITTIQGNALDATNAGLPFVAVRLRNARSGSIVETTTTDKTGLFAFRVYDPGSYVVELMGRDQTVLAASQILNVDAGEAVSAIVKLPFRIPPFAGVLGHSTSSAALLSSVAAASGVLATTVTGEPVSPNR